MTPIIFSTKLYNSIFSLTSTNNKPFALLSSSKFNFILNWSKQNSSVSSVIKSFFSKLLDVKSIIIFLLSKN